MCHPSRSKPPFLVAPTLKPHEARLMEFLPSHLHNLTSSHLLIFASSHLRICSSSHLLIFTSAHLRICSSSHPLILTSSHLHILTSSHLILLSSLPSCPLALSFFSISLLKAGAGAVPTRWHETQPFRRK